MYKEAVMNKKVLSQEATMNQGLIFLSKVRDHSR
jgi:hypothetical protein